MTLTNGIKFLSAFFNLTKSKGDEMEKIVVNGKTYVPEKSCGEIKIAVLQRGWVMVGRFERSGNDCALKDASVVRRWGTSKGLGEIALEGPKSETVLDPCGNVQFDYLTVVALLDCAEEKWKNAL